MLQDLGRELPENERVRDPAFPVSLGRESTDTFCLRREKDLTDDEKVLLLSYSSCRTVEHTIQLDIYMHINFAETLRLF